MSRKKSRVLALKTGDKIDKVVLFASYDWICYLCKEKIDKRLLCPDPMAASIDHVVPLSRGGTHTWDNVMPAHAICNFMKSNLV